MKKFLLFVLLFICVIGFSGCSDNGASGGSSSAGPSLRSKDQAFVDAFTKIADAYSKPESLVILKVYDAKYAGKLYYAQLTGKNTYDRDFTHWIFFDVDQYGDLSFGICEKSEDPVESGLLNTYYEYDIAAINKALEPVLKAR